MFSNYLKIAFRTLWKNRLYTGLNIAGLALGIATCLLIALYVRDELRYDRYLSKADRIYRINSDIRFGGRDTHYAVAPDPMAFTLKNDYPEVENACRFRMYGDVLVKKGDQNIAETRLVYADSTLFDVFSFKLLEGNPQKALTEPNTLVLSESAARKYFGASRGILGRSLRLNDREDWRITGVFEDMPAQSHMHWDFICALAGVEEAQQGIWASHNFNSYLLLRPGVSPEAVASKFEPVIRKYTAPQLKAIFGVNYDEVLAQGNYLKYSLMNVRDIHLHSDYDVEMEANSDVRYVWIFSAVAFFVLLIACVNFMNLSTARSSGRAREVGLRKVFGSGRRALISQFLAESLVLTIFAFALALAAVMAALPSFNQFSGKEIRMALGDGSVLVGLGVLACFTALLAGSYPAFYLSAFRPIEVLKGKLAVGLKSGWLRSTLVVFQFCTSIALIVSVLVVQKQLNYVQTKKLGFDKEQLLALLNVKMDPYKALSFKEELRQVPGVANVTASDFFPVGSSRSETSMLPEGQTNMANAIMTQNWSVDFDYIPTLGMRLLEGRNFDHKLRTDSMAAVVNQSCAKLMGGNVIGKHLLAFTDQQAREQRQIEIVGVVEDFHFASLRQNISPVVMTIGNGAGSVGIRLHADADIQQTLAGLEAKVHQFLPGQPFTYGFADAEFDKQYRAEQRIGKILAGFAGFAIFIACLGLFGLAAFTTEQRTKEIGIRKVLGATVAGIAGLLARDFLKLVFIALLLSIPIAWYAMERWLSDFAYRTSLSWWLFALAGLSALGIALLTVSFQSIRTALSNPLKSLRSE